MRTAAEPSGPGSGSASNAEMPSDAPVMFAPAGSVSAPVPAYRRSADSSPALTVYLNAREGVPEPDAYAALAGGLPTSSPISGIPVTATGRENITLISTVAPSAYVPAGADTDVTDGASPFEAWTMPSRPSGEDGTAYAVGPASPAAGGATARLEMPPLPAAEAAGTTAARRSRAASYTRTDPPDAAYSVPVPASSARSRGSLTAVSTWYRKDGMAGLPAAAAAKPSGTASAYAESVPFSYRTYSFERVWSIAMPAAV